MTSFEATNSVYNTTDENNSFSISTLNFRTPEGGEVPIKKLNGTLELKSHNVIELHPKEFEGRCTRTEIENSGHNLTGFDHFKVEIVAELGRVKYEDLEDKVHRMELTYDAVVDILDVKYIAGSTNGYILSTGIFEDNNFNLMLLSFALR